MSDPYLTQKRVGIFSSVVVERTQLDYGDRLGDTEYRLRNNKTLPADAPKDSVSITEEEIPLILAVIQADIEERRKKAVYDSRLIKGA